MPIKSRTDGFLGENSLYAPIQEFATLVLALDHFYREVVEGNAPLTNRGDSTERWWEQRVVPERVNRYSRNWCLLYEVLASLRERIEAQSVRYEEVRIDADLNFTYHGHRRGQDEPAEPMEWVPEGESD